MKVWTVVNQKGGVGKTTSAISIAASLTKLGHNVLLIDLDPQASLTHYLGFESEQLALSVYDVLVSTITFSQSNETLQSLIKQASLATKIDKLSLLPSHMALATLDRTLSEQIGKGLIVQKFLAILESQYDYVVIDCQPALGVLMVNALVAAHSLILPTQTEHLAILGLNKMLNTITQMKNSLRTNVKITIVPSMFDRRVKACLLAYASMRENYPENLWRGYIPTDTKFREASTKGLPINYFAQNARGAFAYEKLTADLIKRG